MSQFDLQFTPEFTRQIKKLDKRYQLAALRQIKKLISNPFQGKALRGKLKGKFSLRIGDYRVIYLISPKGLIFILTIGHRRDIYKRQS